MGLVIATAWLASGYLGLYICAKRYRRKLSWAIKKNPVTTVKLILAGPSMLLVSIASPDIPERQRYLNKIIKEEIDPYISGDWLEREFQTFEAEIANR